MPSLETIGRLLLFVGVGIAILGGLLILASKVPFLSQLGNLPGDIHIQIGNVSCVFPLATMLIISVLLTIVANIVIRFLNR
ncbi:MAG TPA: DUF2905 domain-containing protein [Aggregatilineales bacterium]|nr:DUF2905 domain-containing protein [Aggregatilineales bacterium]